jgi:hypothetical protein
LASELFCNNKTNVEFTVELGHMRGFYFIYGVQFDYNTEIGNKNLTLSIETSIIEFYFKKSAITKEQCSRLEGLITNDLSTLFNSFRSIVFGRDVKYTGTVCALMFNNSNLDSLYLAGLVRSLVKVNIWRFGNDVSAYLFAEFRSSISSLSVSGYNYELDESIMHPRVFELTGTLAIQASINSIQVDLFKSFAYLRNIQVYMDILKNFFHTVGLDWAILFECERHL